MGGLESGRLTYEQAIDNGTNFNDSVQKALEDGIIDKAELKALSDAYKENLSKIINISKKNLKELSDALNADGSLRDTFNKLKSFDFVMDDVKSKEYSIDEARNKMRELGKCDTFDEFKKLFPECIKSGVPRMMYGVTVKFSSIYQGKITFEEGKTLISMIMETGDPKLMYLALTFQFKENITYEQAKSFLELIKEIGDPTLEKIAKEQNYEVSKSIFGTDGPIKVGNTPSGNVQQNPPSDHSNIVDDTGFYDD